MKKIIPFLFCLAPAVAMGVVYDPGSGNSVGADGSLNGLNAGETIIVKSGNGIKVGTGGITLTDNLYVGQDDQGAPTGQLYIEAATNSVFSIVSDGNISVGGVMDIRAGRTLSLGTEGTPINATFGSISNLGILNIYNIASFTSGSIISSNNMSISAGSINTGTVNINGGNANITASGLMQMAQFINNGTGTSTLTAAQFTGGDVQNNTGITNINISGAITSTGSFENSGTSMNVSAGGLSVAGTVKNDSVDSVMLLNITGDFTVNGGDSLNASFVNKGDLHAVITGNTHLENGFDLSAMLNSNEFYFETGTISFGAGWTTAQWMDLFSNNLNLFELIINNGDIAVNSIINGSSNSSANMHVQAQSVTVNNMVENFGNELNIIAKNSGAGAINITGTVKNHSNSITNILSDGGLTIGGAVTNEGEIVLNGNDVDIDSILNTGNLELTSLTDVTGNIIVQNDFTNSGGTSLINARQILIGGALKNTGGVITVRGSDYNGGGVSIGSIAADGGIINLDSLVGAVDVDGIIDVTGGALNFLANTKSVTAGDTINITGDLTASAINATGAGNVNIAGSGTQSFVMKSTGGNISIGGNVTATANDASRSITIDADVIDIAGNVTAGNQGKIIFGDTLATHLNVLGAVVSNSGGLIDFNVDDTQVGSLSGGGKFIARGHTIEATDAVNNAINIQNGIWFDGTNPATGLVVTDTNDLTLLTSGAGGDINIAGGIGIGTGNRLALNSNDLLTVSGNVLNKGALDINSVGATSFTGQITNNGDLDISAATVTTRDIINTGAATINSNGTVTTTNITNSGDMSIDGTNIVAGAINSSAGTLDITGTSLGMTLMSLTGGVANLNTASITASGNISATGDLNQGGTGGMLNLTRDNTLLTANNLTVGGDFIASQYAAEYNIQNAFSVAGDMDIASGASTNVSASTITIGDVTNNGTLSLVGGTVSLGDVVSSGTLAINSGSVSRLTVDSFETTGGGATLTGIGMNSAGVVSLAGDLLQNSASTPTGGDVNVISNNYVINASNISATGINQTSGSMTLNTDELNISGSIDATDLRIAALGSDWLHVNIGGDVSGGVDFIGLESMTIGGDYTFDDNSILMAAILDRGVTQRNYWATVSLVDDGTFGIITNGANAEPLISVNGKFISDLTASNPNIYNTWDTSTAGELQESQLGAYITDIVDPGTAIWLVHADEGIEELAAKMHNAVVRFCNASGTVCYNYLDSLRKGSTNEDDLPIYVSVRDTDGDGEPDSIYLVFDPRFGGPVKIWKIQPVVGAEPDHTDGEYVTAGALDDLLEGRLIQLGFYNDTPLELVEVIFQNTNLEEMAKELYDRMVQYEIDRHGAGLARFSRLFQPREIEQIIGNIALNEHTVFRDFEDRMFDEFIWNRYRNLKKAWVDVDFGMLRQKTDDGTKAAGERFSIQGGFDWMDTETLMLGLAGHISHTTSNSIDNINLGYKPDEFIRGRVDIDVATTSIGVGGYLMKILGQGARAYGNAFLDLHMISVEREQNFVAPIEGSGTSISIITEWGILHDILNQYIVGNVYARAGYNFGFSVTEKAGGGDYMNLESDGYFILTPGYSVIAQKRIYPSPWFQIRPYLSVGAEYDVLGTQDVAQFKFAYASKFQDYNVDIDPLWVNGGGGVELLSVTGVQIGLDYRYQFNSDIQMHKIKISGSYRF